MTRSPLFGAVTGLLALDVLLQGLWAGIFLQRGEHHGWVTTHSVGGLVAVVLALASVVVAAVQLRGRRDLLAGSVVVLVLVIAEYGIGQAVSGGTRGLTAVHVPLALVVMAGVTWLPLRARAGAPAATPAR